MNKNNLIGIALLLLLLNIFFIRNNKNNDKKEVKTENVENNKNNDGNVEKDEKNNSNISYNNIEKIREDRKNIVNLEHKEENILVLENDYIKYTFSNIGASLIDVELKKYKNHKGENVKLVADNSLIMSLNFKKLNINTTELSFNETVSNDIYLTFKFVDVDGNNIEITYELDKENPYIIKQKINSTDNSFLEYTFNGLLIQNEKYLEDCKNKSSLNYYLEDGNFKTINNVDSKVDKVKQDIKHCEWISYKQKFFTIGITSNSKMNGESYIKYNKDYINEYNSTINFTDNISDLEIKYYFGPNKLEYMQGFHKTFDKNIYLGMIGVGVFNKYIILPMSRSFGIKIGGILFLIILALLIKLLLLPINYRLYEITKKMQLLSKLLNVLGNKYKNNQQQLAMEQINAYRELGINPLSMILFNFIQFPFVIAIYNYIPLDFLYRNTSFLWCSDLASYDSIFNIGYYIPLYGDHISLSAILMAVTMFIYMITNGSTNENDKSISPIYIFFVIFILCISNRFCCALNIYYLFFNIITFINQYIFSKKFDLKPFEDKVNKKIKSLL